MTAMLREAEIEAPRREARILLAHALGVEQDALPSFGLVPERLGYDFADRRAAHEPLAYIIGQREFWSLMFKVSPVTLIPRPDSETLIEAALDARPDRSLIRHILDLGTGTGCLLLAALSEYPEAFGIGVDFVPEAALLARDNARALHMQDRAAFLVGDWASALNGRFDLILANPPYISHDGIARLMPEVAWHEPHLALDGGRDGLSAYRTIIGCLPALLAPKGLAILELGQGQAEAVTALARHTGFSASCREDLAGIPRAIIINL